MSFPKLKNALLCRVLVYVVVLGAFIVPIVLVAYIPMIPVAIKWVFGALMLLCLVFYIIRNFALLMSMDIELALLHCQNTARRQFDLPRFVSITTIEKRLSRFGRGYEPTSIYPKPAALRYKFNSPLTIYTSGIERVVLVYHTDFLDKNTFGSIFKSASANSYSLRGKKKALFLDSAQKSSPLSRVTVAVIFAKAVDDGFREGLFDTVCKQDGDGWEKAFLPCVIDIQNRVCVFNSLRLPYYGFAYPAKNRGIGIIRKRIFGGRLPLSKNPYILESKNGIDIEESLWQYWRKNKKKYVISERKNKKRFEKMEHNQVLTDGDFLYVKLKQRGAMFAVSLDKESKTAEIECVNFWSYPKANAISKNDALEIRNLISNYFSELGFYCTFVSLEE